MKQSIFLTATVVFALVISIVIFMLVLGNSKNFQEGSDKHKPINMLGTVYLGGPLVVGLLMLSITTVAVIIERTLTLQKAAGKKAANKFFLEMIETARKGDLNRAIQLCDEQRGSLASVLRAAISRYQELTTGGGVHDPEKRLLEVQRAAEEATMLETPLLERNLVALSTMASIATMVGLLGTTMGMIRSFTAMAQAGSPDAVALATGISEALINTAGGLIAAIMGIIAYNFFTTKVDSFTYMIDEGVYSLVEIFKAQSK